MNRLTISEKLKNVFVIAFRSSYDNKWYYLGKGPDGKSYGYFASLSRAVEFKSVEDAKSINLPTPTIAVEHATKGVYRLTYNLTKVAN